MAIVTMFPSGEPRKTLNDLPIFDAPSPTGDGSRIKLQVAQSTIDKLILAKRRTALFEAWVHLIGEMPPVNNAELVRRTEWPHAELNTIMDACACFKGVRRRYADDDNGGNVFVYIIKTTHTVRWNSDLRCVAGIVECATDTVLTVQVKESGALHGCQEGVWGAATKWEFINADREHLGFPDRYDDRYDHLLWSI